MSQDIICPECQFANVPGSKFCNNCGAKLPLGTHIICSNCNTSNPIDRIFCDHCGTRLLPDKPSAEQESEEPSPAGGKAFTLPTRKPGETGDLDPHNVPDWLKTGETQKEPEVDGLEEEELPRVEELTQKKQTDDLPEWLINESDSDPIIHAPTIISTEFYKDLLDKTGEEDEAPAMDDLFPDEQEGDLPDWLKEAGTEPPEAADQPPSDESTEGLTEFLSGLPDAADFEEEPPQSKKESGSLTSLLSDEDDASGTAVSAEDAAPGLTDWLDQMPDEEERVDEDEGIDDSLTGWLSEPPAEEPEPTASEKSKTPSLTEWLSEVPGEQASETVEEHPEDIEGSLTSWLSELPDEADVVEEQPDISENLTGWLAELPDDEEETPAAPAAEGDEFVDWPMEDDVPDTEELDMPIGEPGTSESLADWLPDEDDFEFEELEDADSIEEPAQEDFSSRLSDWLSAESDLDSGMGEGTTADAPAGEPVDSDMTDWLPDEELPDEEEEEEAVSAKKEVDRLSAWISSKSDEEGVSEGETEERFDWLEEPEAPVTASGKHEIPSEMDWLEETEAGLANIFQSQPSIEEELPDWLAGVAAEGDSFIAEADSEDVADLEDIFEAEQKAVETELDFLQETGSLRLDSDLAGELDLDEALSEADLLSDAIRSDEPDWLADLARMGPDDLDIPEEVDADTAVVDALDLSQTSEATDDIEDESPMEVGAGPEDDLAPILADSSDDQEDWEESSDVFDEPMAEGELPDWINQLDATGDLPDVDDSELIPSDEMPEWVASLKPGQGRQDSVLPGALAEDIPETLAGIPEELAGSDLPDWLQDVPKEPAAETPPIPVPRDIQISDIPDWLQPGLELAEDEDINVMASSSAGKLDPTPVSDEWGAILNDLPPAVPLEETLSKAEIPEWVMELKPAELTGEEPKAAPVPEGPEETYGALSGLRGVVVVEPIIARPRSAGPPAPYTVSPEQQQQVLLLRQLAENGHAQQRTKAVQAGRDISAWTRPLFALILIVVVALGLQGALPVNLPETVPVTVAGVDAAVSEAAGKTVLVAFEYSPAMAGELTPEAETLLIQLNENESAILALSQFATGVPIASSVIADTEAAATNLGYLPGGPIGLRRLGECLGEDANCDDLFGQPLSPGQKNELSNVELIIVLTATRENLVNWIEQVGSPTGYQMVAGVTQSLYPIASPYFNTQQLQGVLNGIPGTAVYQNQYFENNQLIENEQVTEVKPLFDAQVTAQILLFIVLLLGAVIYIISGFVTKRRQN